MSRNRDRANAVLARWRCEVRDAFPSADLEFMEELAQHLAEVWIRRCDEQMDAAEADRQAYAELAEWRGRAPRRRPSVRAALGWFGIVADVRFAVRALRVRPLFTVGAALLSMIAVTAITCTFAIVYGILWRPLPFPASDRLAVVWQVEGGEPSQISHPDFADVTGASVFEASALVSGGRGSMRVGDAIERINLLDLAPAGFSMLGVTPLRGRVLNEADAGTPVAMISHRLWTSRLDSDPAILGRMLWISGREYTVVGVLRQGFDFELPVPPSFRREKNDVWRVLEPSPDFAGRREVSTYEALVRLAPGQDLRGAQVAADAIGARLAREHPGTNAGRTFKVASLRDEVVSPVRRPLMFVLAGAAATMLVALANLMVLGLMRSSERQAELAIREALGAGAMRLRRQLLSEGALIALCGAVLGVVVAREIVGALLVNEAAHLPRADAIRFDAPVWWAAAAVTLLVSVVLAAQPLRRGTASLRLGGRTASPAVRRSRRLLVAAEIALALVLTTGGGLLALSFARLLAVDPGFDPSGGATARVSAYAARYPSRDDVVRFFEAVVQRTRAVPQVEAAGASSSLPLSGQHTGTAVVAEGRSAPPASRQAAGWQFVTPGYFEAAGLRIRAGRDFASVDAGRASHVAIINEALAQSLFPAEDPIGRRIGVGGGETDGDWHEVVGVVADVRHQALDASPEPRVYDLFGQHWGRTLFVVARSGQADAAPLMSAMRGAVAAVDREAPVFEPAMLTALVDRSAAANRLSLTIAASLAAAGVLLALIGVYAVTGASVAERTREIGLRAALGAAPGDLFRLIAAEGVRTTAGGGLAGLAGSLLLARALQAQLFGVRETDLLWLVPVIAAAMLGAAGLAAVPAARRAASADPLIAMRE